MENAHFLDCALQQPKPSKTQHLMCPQLHPIQSNPHPPPPPPPPPAEPKALVLEAGSADRAIQRAHHETRALESDTLRALSEATTAEKSSAKTAADIEALRGACDKEELRIAEVQNELAKLQVGALGVMEGWQGVLCMCPVAFRGAGSGGHLSGLLPIQTPQQVDMLNTAAHNGRLAEALALLEAELTDKVGGLGLGGLVKLTARRLYSCAVQRPACISIRL